MTARDPRIDALYAARPRSRFVRASFALLLLFMAGSWLAYDFGISEALSDRRVENLRRFAGEVRPFPLQGRDWDSGVAWRWVLDQVRDHGLHALLMTLAIALLAIDLAGLLGGPLALFAARNVATPRPFGVGRQATLAAQAAWSAVVLLARAILIFLRALPEYVWAFLLVATLGPSPWPLVIALALHNAGILGRLTAEVVENSDPGPSRALRAAGASRFAVAATSVAPGILPRFLLYFFYRWESCVRDATVLGLLNVVSLGYWIAEHRSRMQYDGFVLMILLGSLLVLAGDLMSAALRGVVRRAG